MRFRIGTMNITVNGMIKLLKISRKKGMVFKPSFKCFKNEKINFTPAFLKLETLLFQNMFILFYHILYL